MSSVEVTSNSRFQVPEQLGQEESRVIYLSPLLEKLGIPPQLLAEIRNLEVTAAPLAELYLPKDPSDIPHGGRVVYHDLDPYSLVLMVKGAGNIHFATGDKYHDRFPGYPASLEDLFVDDPKKRRATRIWGAESAYDGAMEQINAALILAQKVATKKITSLSEAISEHLTIPLSITYMPALSQEMNHLRLQSKDPGSKWPYNKWLARVCSVVPSNQRVLAYEHISGENISSLERAVDETVAHDVAKNLRDLLNIGLIYHGQSSHLQNFYYPTCSPADLSDLVFLADFSEEGRIFFLYQMLVRDIVYNVNNKTERLGLIPPLFKDKFGNREPQMDKTIRAQLAFWKELLSGTKIEEVRVELLPLLLCLYPDKRSLVVRALSSILLSSREDQIQDWEQFAQKRIEIVRHMEEMFTSIGLSIDMLSEIKLKREGGHDYFLHVQNISKGSGKEQPFIQFLTGESVPDELIGMLDTFRYAFQQDIVASAYQQSGEKLEDTRKRLGKNLDQILSF